MKCKNCEFEYGEQYEYCPNCGAPRYDIPPADSQQAPVEPVSINPAADRIMPILKDKKLLTVCILMTVGCVCALTSSIPVISILITIFLWLLYSDAQKGFANEKHLRSISGTIYATYVLAYVAGGLLIFVGLLFGIIFAAASNIPEFIESFSEALYSAGLSEFDFNYNDIPQIIIGIIGWIFAGVFITIGVVNILINALGVKKIHAFIKSVHTGISYQCTNFEKVRPAKNWIMFFGIIHIIDAVFMLMSLSIAEATANGCMGVAIIVAATMIDKYLLSEQTQI